MLRRLIKNIIVFGIQSNIIELLKRRFPSATLLLFFRSALRFSKVRSIGLDIANCTLGSARAGDNGDPVCS